jgi:flagellar basal body-associated protein FliL
MMHAFVRWVGVAGLMTMLALVAPQVLASEHGGGHGGEKEAPPSPFIQLEDLNVSIFGDRSVRGILTVSMSLQVEEPAKHEEVTARQPLLRDAYVRSVSQFAGSRLDLRQPINIVQLGALLQRTTDRVLGDNVAKVLIASAAIRPM